MKEKLLFPQPMRVLCFALFAGCMVLSQTAGAQSDEKAALAASLLATKQPNAPLPSIVSARPVDLPRDTQQSQSSPAKVPVMPPEKGKFEKYVEAATGKDLKIFGQSLFGGVPSTFAPSEGTPVNPEYVIGAGDELQIRGWGMVDIDVTATVDRTGAISIPKVGAVKVSGVKYRDLQGYLTKAVAKLYNNFQLSVSVSQARAVQVYVVGHAMQPGTYTLSAMSTLLNALFTSGGPDAIGSMRDIQLKRGASVVTHFDLYDMLINGDKSKDVSLRDGDVIFIPAAGSMVALTGNVKQPAIFELNGPTSVADVVRWAGGFESSAAGQPIIVEKNVDNGFRTVAEFPASSEPAGGRLGSVPVGAADILRVFAPGAMPVQIRSHREYVTVSGEAKHTGVFEIKPGETLRELVARLGGATSEGYMFAMRVQRESVRRAQQEKLNQAAERYEHDLEASASERLAQTADKDTVAVINAELQRDRDVAKKMREVKAEGRIVLELANGAAQVKDLPDLPLQDGDTVFIPRKPGTVEVIGAVYQQNSILYRPRRTVNDYVALAGGTTDGADKSEMYLIRADGTAESGKTAGWFGSLGGATVNPGDAIIVPEKVGRTSWVQSFKEWTAIFYQFGLGAAGLKVLRN